MRLRTDSELTEDRAQKRRLRRQRIAVNFVTLLAAVFFFVTLTHSAALDAADDFASSGKTAEQISADFDIPFAVEHPPKGSGWLLNRAHLRWLIREEIRLNAMRDSINFENERAIKEYMEQLDEFNAVAARCFCEHGDFRAATRDIEPYREKIVEAAHLEAEANGWHKWE